MAESMEEMAVRITGDARNYEMAIQSSVAATQRLEQTINASNSKVSQIGTSLENYGRQVQGFLLGLAASFGVNGLMGTIQSAVGKAIDTEQTEIAFRSLIGNANEAMTLLANLRKFAVNTPFEVPQILGAAKQMLAYGQTVNEILPTMQRLGDVASGLNIPMSSLAYLYGTLKSSGRVMTVDMRQFAGRGIPIWLYLAKAIGMVSMETRKLTGEQSGMLAQMVTKGKITFPMIEKSFELMTSKGGQFFNMMEDQSKSMGGIISNLKDSMGLLLADIGEQIIEGFDLKRVVKEVGAIAQAFATWFKNMDPQVKKTMFLLVGVVGALGGIIAVVLAAKMAFMGLGMVIATVGWPFLIVAGLVVAAVALWVEEVGGVNKALDIVKEKAIAFWEWLEPIRQGIYELGKALWEALGRTFQTIRRVAGDTWKNMQGESEISWTEIRDGIADALLKVEYVMLKVEKTSQEVIYRIGESLGGVVWVLQRIIETQVRVYNMLLLINEQSSKFSKYLDLFAPAWRLMGFGTNKNLDKLDQKLKDLPDTFEEFKRQREELRKKMPKADELLPLPKDDEVKDKGKEIGQALKQGVKEGVKDLDSVLFGSAESLRRFDAYLERLKTMGKQAGQAAAAAAAQATGGVGSGGGVVDVVGPGRTIPDRIKAVGESAATAINNVGEAATYNLANMMEQQVADTVAATHLMSSMMQDQANTVSAAIEQVANASAASIETVGSGSEAATETILSNHLSHLRGRWNSLANSVQAWQPDPLRDLGAMFDLGTGYLTNPQGGVDAALTVLQEIRDLIGNSVNGPRLEVEGADVGGL